MSAALILFFSLERKVLHTHTSSSSLETSCDELSLMMSYVCEHAEDSALCAPVEECRLAAQCVARSLPNGPMPFGDFGLVVCETCTSLTPQPPHAFFPTSHSLFFEPHSHYGRTPPYRSGQIASTQEGGKKKTTSLSLWPLEQLFCQICMNMSWLVEKLFALLVG